MTGIFELMSLTTKVSMSSPGQNLLLASELIITIASLVSPSRSAKMLR
jgi:hypothetical protein